jgi:hypothetical protein
LVALARAIRSLDFSCRLTGPAKWATFMARQCLALEVPIGFLGPIRRQDRFDFDLLPEQYFWVHKRFKTRPHGEASPYERAAAG